MVPKKTATAPGSASPPSRKDAEFSSLPEDVDHYWFLTANLHWEGSLNSETLTVEAFQKGSRVLFRAPEKDGSFTQGLWGRGITETDPFLVRVRLGQETLAEGSLDPASARKSVVDGHIQHMLLVELTIDVPPRIHGQIVDPGGSPIAGASIGVYQNEGGSTRPVNLALSSTSQSGFFAITGIGEPATVVAAGSGLRPKSIAIDPRVGDVDLGVIQLSHGFSIRGNVALRSFEKDRGLSVLVRLRGGTYVNLAHQEGASYSLLNGRFETNNVEVALQEDGSFSVSGLAPSVYSISYGGRFDGGECLPWDGPVDPAVDVRAPASGVRLAFEAPRVWVHVTDERGGVLPPPGAMFMDQQGQRCFTDRQGGILISILSQETRSFTVSAPGFEPQQLDVGGLGSADYVERELRLRHEDRTSRIVLKPGPGQEVQFGRLELRMWFANVDQPREANDWSTLDADKEGQFVIENVFPGRYWIDLRPYSYSELQTYWRVKPIKVVVEPGKVARGALWYEQGGRLAVRIVDSGGNWLSRARCEVFPSGSPNPMRQIRFMDVDLETGSMGLDPFFPHKGTRGVQGFIQASPALPTSTYTVVATLDGYLEASHSVNLRKGETTNLRLVLEPRE